MATHQTTNQTSAIYQRSIQKYQEITGETLDIAFLAQIQNVDDLAREIDERNKSFREFREKRHVLFDGLRSALLPVELVGNLAAGGCATAFPPSSLVFGAVTYLVSAAKGVSTSYDAIQDLMDSLKDFTIRLKTYSQEAISDDLSNKLSDILVTLVEIFALSTKAIRRGRLLKYTRNLLLGNGDAIQDAIGKLDKLTQVEANLVGAETLIETKRTGRVVNDISGTVNETGVVVHQMSLQVNDVQEMLSTLIVSVGETKQEGDGEREKSLLDVVTKTLRPSKADLARNWYDKISKTRIPGTGDWVRNENTFKGWVSREFPIIFISGNPGAGKSYLSTNIIDFLQDYCLQTGRESASSIISVGYFFFKDDNPDTRSFRQALRDLAFQISQNDPVYQRYLATIRDYESIETLESAWRVLFVDFFLRRPNSKSTVYVLLDAVDEAFEEERKIFMSLAKELHNAPDVAQLQLALVGRPHLSDQLFEGLEAETPTIHVTSQKNSADISQYIQASIKKSAVLRRVSAKLRREILEKLSAGAEGMFLWVNLMMQELVKRRSESSIRKALEQAPKGLREMLRHVLSSFSASLPEEELEFLNELLLWVACSEQPLTLAQVESICRLKSPDGDGMIYLEGALRRQFAAFFNLNREDTLTTAELQHLSSHLDGFDGSDHESCGRDADEDVFEDVENLIDFDSDRQTTTVTFCHASIGDFLRDNSEGKVSAGNDYPKVGVNIHEAKAHVLKTFLRLFTDPNFAAKADDDFRMLQHASQNWVHHLLTSSPSKTSPEDKLEIAKLLLATFRSEPVIETWVGYCSWNSTNAAIAAIRQWWEDERVWESLTEEDRQFISTLQEEKFAIFEPLFRFCAHRWLCEVIWDPTPLAAMIWSYQSLIKGRELNILERFDPTAEDIIEAAVFGGKEKNALWHQRVAVVLRAAGHHDRALEFFAKALELDPNNHITKAGMAKTYMRKRDWVNAIKLDEQVMTLVEAEAQATTDSEEVNLNLFAHDCLERMGESYKRLGNLDEWHAMSKRAFNMDPSCGNCIVAIVEYQRMTFAHEEIIDFLRRLKDTPVPGKDYSVLTQSLWDNADRRDSDYFHYVADAALATGNLQLLVDALRTATRAARKVSKTVITAHLDMSLAEIYSKFLHDTPKAIKRWEKIVDTYASSKEESMIGIIKLRASYSLARAYLHNAIEAGVGSPEAEILAGKIENIIQRVKINNESYLRSLGDGPTICLGVYYRLSGRIEEAMALLRPFIQWAIRILSDDNPDNDIFGVLDLVGVLAAAKDVKNTIAISYAMNSKPFQNSVKSRKQGEEEEGEGDSWGLAEWTCDGNCRETIPIREDYYMCPICLDEFCPKCMKLLEEGSMPLFVCSRTHVSDFIYIPPLPKEFTRRNMLVDGEEVEWDVWKAQLLSEWGIQA